MNKRFLGLRELVYKPWNQANTTQGGGKYERVYEKFNSDVTEAGTKYTNLLRVL